MKSTDTVAAAPPARGRPRDPGRDAAILDAALGVLVEVGYDQLSVELVAARARVGKATIYRRYDDKAELVVAAIEQSADVTVPRVHATNERDAMFELLQWLARGIATHGVGVLGAVFAGMRRDPALASAMQRVLRRDQNAMVQQLMQVATAQQASFSPRAANIFVEVAPALLVQRVLMGQRCDRRFLKHVTDDILVPLTRTA